MNYEVIKTFSDRDDEGHSNELGTAYPREGYTPSEERCQLLAGNENRMGTPVIKVVTEADLSDEAAHKTDIDEEATHKTNSDENEETNDEEATHKTEQVKEPVNVDDLTVSELKEALDTLGVTYLSKDTKAVLVDKVKDALK